MLAPNAKGQCHVTYLASFGTAVERRPGVSCHPVTAKLARSEIPLTHQSGSNRYSILSNTSPSYGVPGGKVSRVPKDPQLNWTYPQAMPAMTP